jgi:hypothetical protein
LYPDRDVISGDGTLEPVVVTPLTTKPLENDAMLADVSG